MIKNHYTCWGWAFGDDFKANSYSLYSTQQWYSKPDETKFLCLPFVAFLDIGLVTYLHKRIEKGFSDKIQKKTALYVWLLWLSKCDEDMIHASLQLKINNESTMSRSDPIWEKKFIVDFWHESWMNILYDAFQKRKIETNTFSIDSNYWGKKPTTTWKLSIFI